MKILKTILKIIYKIFKAVILVFILLLATLIFMQRFSDNKISFMGYRMFAVVTSSMAPKYNVNDVLLCKEVDTSTIKIGDDITYVGETGSFNNRLVTHRVIKILENEDGTRTFQTKGIASQSPDPLITDKQVYGKIVKELEIMSIIYGFISTSTGFYLCIFVPLAILIGTEIVESMVEKFEEKKLKASK